jgi:hypothetical protein
MAKDPAVLARSRLELLDPARTVGSFQGLGQIPGRFGQFGRNLATVNCLNVKVDCFV